MGFFDKIDNVSGRNIIKKVLREEVRMGLQCTGMAKFHWYYYDFVVF